MKYHSNCIFCNSPLLDFQRLLGRCNWCMKELSDEANKGDESLVPDMSYSFTDDEYLESDED